MGAFPSKKKGERQGGREGGRRSGVCWMCDIEPGIYEASKLPV